MELESLAAVFSTVAFAVTAVMSAVAVSHREKSGGTPLAVLLIAVAWWVGAHGVTLQVDGLQAKLLWTKLQWIGIVVAPIAWLWFAMEYTGRRHYLTIPLVFLCVAFSAVTLLFVATNASHELIVTGSRLTTYRGMVLLDQTFGLWYWTFVGFSYALMFVGALMLLQLAADSRSLYRGQAGLLMVAVATPWVSHVAYIVGAVPASGLDVTPFAFVISGLAALAALVRYGLFDAAPVPRNVAREVVLGGLDDGIVVVDTNDRIVDLNERAAAIVGLDESEALGRSACATIPGYQPADGAAQDETTITIGDGGVERHYQVRRTDLTDARGRQSARVVLLLDVTERHYHEQRLDVLNRVLRHNLRNEMNVIYGLAEGAESEDATERIQEKALAVAEMGDKAREIERLLAEEGRSGEREAVAVVLRREVDRARETYPDADVTLDLPEADLGYCQSTFGPVVWNLVENAVEHNQDDSPTLDVAATVEDDSVRVSVADDGPGIPERERVVLDAGTETPLHHASGLGLWLVVWGVHRIGGSVSFAENDPRGSVVTVEFSRKMSR